MGYLIKVYTHLLTYSFSTPLRHLLQLAVYCGSLGQNKCVHIERILAQLNVFAAGKIKSTYILFIRSQLLIKLRIRNTNLKI